MRKPLAIGTQLVAALVLAGAAAAAFSHRDAALELLGLDRPAEASSRGERDGGGGAPVIATEVVSVSDATVIEAVGTGAALRSVTLRSDAEGAVTALTFDAPKRVAGGEALVQLDDDDEQLALSLAKTRLADAERQLERRNRLERSVAGSTVALDDARTAAEIARIERDQAMNALEKLTIRAPFDGVVGQPQIEVGDRIDRDDVIASFDDRSAINVDFEAPESHLARVAPGAPLTARTPAFPRRVFDGVVEEIDSRLDAATRAIRVRARIPNPDDLLRPGMSFAVQLPLAGEARAATPELALQWEREGGFVWRVIDGEAVKTPVRLLARQGGLALVEPVEEGAL